MNSLDCNCFYQYKHEHAFVAIVDLWLSDGKIGTLEEFCPNDKNILRRRKTVEKKENLIMLHNIDT